MAKLSKQDKVDIIIEAMIENPGARHRRGFQKQIIEMFRTKYDERLNQGGISRLIQEAIKRLDKQDRYFMSKMEYQLQYQRLVAGLKVTQDNVAGMVSYEKGVILTNEQARLARELLQATKMLTAEQRKVLREMTQIDGHLKSIHEVRTDDPMGKALEMFFDNKTGKPKEDKK